MDNPVEARVIYERRFEGNKSNPNGFIFVTILRVQAPWPMDKFWVCRSMGIATFAEDPFHNQDTVHWDWPDNAAARRYGDTLFIDIDQILNAEYGAAETAIPR